MTNWPDPTNRKAAPRAWSSRQIVIANFVVLLVTAPVAGLLISALDRDVEQAQPDVLVSLAQGNR